MVVGKVRWARRLAATEARGVFFRAFEENAVRAFEVDVEGEKMVV